MNITYRTLPQPDKPNKQIQEYVTAFAKGGRLVMLHSSGKWCVVRPEKGNIPQFDTKQEAIDKAEHELRTAPGKVFIFDENYDLVKSYRPKSR